MSFQFRFEKILSMKEKEKESALNELNEIQQKQEFAEREYDQLIEKKESYLDNFSKTLGIKVSITELQEQEQYILFLNKQIEKAANKLADITRELNVKKLFLLEKNKEEKIWSSWRDQSLASYQENLKREEQNVLDEMAVIRYFHNKN